MLPHAFPERSDSVNEKDMTNRTSIEWTNDTWNPVTGCTKVSPGCDHCYAEAIANRFANHFPNGFSVTLHPERLLSPQRMRKPRMIFVNSMSDMFHKDVADEYLDRVFDSMEAADQHIYQCLTKRSSRMRNYVNARYGERRCPPHIWLGVSVESDEQLVRLEHLRQTNANIRFVSFEPLLGPIDNAKLGGLQWAIIGGESGIGHRAMKPAWVRSLREQCQAQTVAFFFKQWGGRTSKANGNELDGRQWFEYPAYHAQWLKAQGEARV